MSHATRPEDPSAAGSAADRPSTDRPTAAGPTAASPTEDLMTRPPLDAASLVLGLILMLIAIVGLLDPSLTQRLDVSVLAPIALMTIGLILLAVTALPRRRRDARPTD